jgi:exosome complex RNA-binding protein Rrp4
VVNQYILLCVQVAQKRWRLDIHYSQDAVLMLSSMNLPDGMQVSFFGSKAQKLYSIACMKVFQVSESL